MDERQQDVQDKAFGAAAAADQEIVDALTDEGATAEDLPDVSREAPRAAGKAEPED